MNRSIIQYMEEGRVGGTTAAVLSGLTGPYGGPVVANWQAQKLSAAELEKQNRSNKLKKEDIREKTKLLSPMGKRNLKYTLAAAIPGVGAYTNYKLAKKRYDLDDELNSQKKKSKKK